MRRILLARHGETAWNAIGRLQGHTDIELNDRGRGQARALAGTLAGAGVTAVWTSDLARARETGAIVAAELGLEPPQIDGDLRERRFGVFEGLTRDECASRFPDAWRDWTAQASHPPGGESRTDATARLGRALARIDRSAGPGAGGPVLVVSHGGVIRLWLMELLGRSVPLVGNGTVFAVDHDGTRFAVASESRDT